MATYSITKEIASQTKVTKGIYLQDFFFLLIYACITLLLNNAVSESLKVPFIIFSIVNALALVSRGKTGRRFYQRIILFIVKDRNVYRAERE